MAGEIIPKVVLKLNSDTLECRWNCPGCGMTNDVFLFSEKVEDAKKEARAIEAVTCLECCRKFETG